MNCIIVKKPAFALVGYDKVFDHDTAYREIPAYWDEVMAKTAGDVHAGKRLGVGEYAACIDDVGNDKFRYMIAGLYTGGQIPKNMLLHEFSASEWAIFDCIGPIPKAFQALNTKVFREWLPGNPEFELAAPVTIEWYDEGDPSSPDYHSAIWLPVRRRT